VTDALGESHLLDYDAQVRVVAETGPDNRTSRLSYYPDSNEVRTVTSPTGEVARTGVDLGTGDARYELDPRNEELRLSGQPYVATVYVRDAAGNPTSVQTNRYAADATPSSVDLETDPFPAYTQQLRRTGYTYGAGGVLASMTDPRGNVTSYAYNASGYLTKIDSPAGTGETSRRVVTITPNADGSISSDVDAKGQKTANEYDGWGG
jgi:YD repeat-containing protein